MIGGEPRTFYSAVDATTGYATASIFKGSKVNFLARNKSQSVSAKKLNVSSLEEKLMQQFTVSNFFKLSARFN